MAQLPSLTTVPLIPRPGILPMRVVPRIFPRLMSYATRVRVHTENYIGTLPDGTKITIAGADLTPKLISNSVSAEGDLHEYYALMRDGDPEAFMDLMTGPSVKEGVVACEVARCGGAAMSVYLDETMKTTFPSNVGVPGPWIGYISFEIPAK